MKRASCGLGAGALALAVICLVPYTTMADIVDGPTVLSGLSPYPDGGDPTDPAAVTACNGAPQTGVVYRNSETEPYIGVNPVNLENMIAVWHQDRWSTGGAPRSRMSRLAMQ